jgi:hypothetical protein
MTDLNPEASAGTPAWWLAHERGLGPDWPSTPAPSGAYSVECWRCGARTDTTHDAHCPDRPAPSGGGTPTAVEALADQVWRESQQGHMIIHDAGIMQDIVLRLRAALAQDEEQQPPTPTAVEALERLLETAVENDDHEGYSAGYIFGLETAIAALVQDKAPIDVDRLNREHPLD